MAGFRGVIAAGLSAVVALGLSGASGLAEPAGLPTAKVGTPRFTWTSPETGGLPLGQFNGDQLVGLSKNRLVGVDTTTGLIRWEGGTLNSLRSFLYLSHRTVMVGEHLQVLDPKDGRVLWDFPLNCFTAAQCNSDLMAFQGVLALVGGFGDQYNMLMLLDLAKGKELWPSWLTTCPLVSAGMNGEAIYSVCHGAKLLQAHGIANRQMLYSVAPPLAGFRPGRAWFGEEVVFIQGPGEDGSDKIVVLSLKDGSFLKSFNAKGSPDPGLTGFALGTRSQTFAPWQTRGDQLKVWGFHAATGALQWSRDLPQAQVVAWNPSVLVVKTTEGAFPTLVAVDLSTGKDLYRIPLYFGEPGISVSGDRIVILSIPDRVVTVVDMDNGQAEFIGQLPDGFAPAPSDEPRVHVDARGAVLTVGRTRILFQTRPAGEELARVQEAVSRGDDKEAGMALASLWPFRSVLVEAQQAYQQVVGLRLLRADLLLQQGKAKAALDAARSILSESESWTAAETAFTFPRVARIAVHLALRGGKLAGRDDFLFEVMDLFVNPTHPSLPRRVCLNALLVLSSSLRTSDYAPAVQELMQQIRNHPEDGTVMEGHPFALQSGLLRLSSLLTQARTLVADYEFRKAVEVLEAVAKEPAALKVFDNSVEAWVDVQSVRLLPADARADQLPGIVEGLALHYNKAHRSVLADAEAAACSAGCRTARSLCEVPCIFATECDRSMDRCLKACRSGQTSYSPPEFSFSASDPRFYQRCLPAASTPGQ
jgi:outer membrane protein assembly factor BamB